MLALQSQPTITQSVCCVSLFLKYSNSLIVRTLNSRGTEFVNIYSENQVLTNINELTVFQ